MTKHLGGSSMAFPIARSRHNHFSKARFLASHFTENLALTYSGTPLNGHTSTADTNDITDNFESPDRLSVGFNTLKIPE